MDILGIAKSFISGVDIVSAVTGGLVAGSVFFVFWALVRIILNVFFTHKKIDDIANIIDNLCDKLQKKDKATGKLWRSKLINIFSNSIARLRENDGCN